MGTPARTGSAGPGRRAEAQPAWLLRGPQRQPRFTSRSGMCPTVSRPPVTAAPGGAAFLPGAPGRSPTLSTSLLLVPKGLLASSPGVPKSCSWCKASLRALSFGPHGDPPRTPRSLLPPCVLSSCLACAPREPSRVGSWAERRLPKDRPTETGRRNLVWKRVFADRRSQGKDLERRLSRIRVAPV